LEAALDWISSGDVEAAEEGRKMDPEVFWKGC
jgi:hypothetical protein